MLKLKGVEGMVEENLFKKGVPRSWGTIQLTARYVAVCIHFNDGVPRLCPRGYPG